MVLAVSLMPHSFFVRALESTSQSSTFIVQNGFAINTTVVPTGRGPLGVAFDPTNGNMYVANNIDNTVAVIHRKTIVAIVPVGAAPWGIAFNGNNGNIYVTNSGASTVSVINSTTNTVKTTITVGRNPLGIAYDAADHYMYVANNADNTVSVIDTNNNAFATLSSGGVNLQQLAYDPADHDIWVSNFVPCCGTASPVELFSGTSDVGHVGVSSGAAGIAFDPVNLEMYVVGYLSNTVSVFNATTAGFMTSISVGSGPDEVAFDSTNNELYVTNTLANTVSVIAGSTNTVDTTISVGSTSSFPLGVAFNPVVRDTYVSLYGDNNVVLIRKSNVVAH